VGEFLPCSIGTIYTLFPPSTSKFLPTYAPIDFLKENITNKDILKKIQKSTETNCFNITLTDKEKSIVLDELTFLFTSKGLINNSEPNKTGLKIEELIDIFSSSVQDKKSFHSA
jgi:hypothetical protein